MVQLEVENVVAYSRGLRKELRWEDLDKEPKIEFKPIETEMTRLYNSPLMGRIVTIDLEDQGEKRMQAQEREVRFSRMAADSDVPVNTLRAVHAAQQRGDRGEQGAQGPAGPSPDLAPFRDMLSTAAQETRRSQAVMGAQIEHLAGELKAQQQRARVVGEVDQNMQVDQNTANTVVNHIITNVHAPQTLNQMVQNAAPITNHNCQFALVVFWHPPSHPMLQCAARINWDCVSAVAGTNVSLLGFCTWLK